MSVDEGKAKRGAVKDQLEALIMQMYKSGITYAEAVCEFKKKFILTVLQDCKGNQCKAARQLGMHRNTLSRTIAELKLNVKELRAWHAPAAAQRPHRHDGEESRPLAGAFCAPFRVPLAAKKKEQPQLLPVSLSIATATYV